MDATFPRVSSLCSKARCGVPSLVSLEGPDEGRGVLRVGLDLLVTEELGALFARPVYQLVHGDHEEEEGRDHQGHPDD